ncbi:TPA: bifunctional proline dehydrogenase/L-glutamate gamma-semialdehyde dehydrogenase PutA [Pasteurella multocida]|uniref:bifunctional proline dehydrogenase/L-glutamate gamma-semialdehyde dehydrogenase PutA n=1 Tax=Pasteurella multocida TaxID=747 RepID=UPI0028DEFEE4|nr:bifunctional proline dehydrogenase/L-glutamate gamma-semialdehyde dehydrogenase PutA [Pasteurella multocida]MDY0498896.1 bifunctional proline dehydrogenase/L-glutamate gamma-semialdehyde dehydrogenase PutA [Pasteurella multocida]MDY0655646.1 bifunctional proline dehydrogenase/L-glutamate gamma-semialdehyde dehydrogenase PutA [Pasteurella multocida]WRU40802.1 bifunctional proline dehydrogenase/L-glutamate gamma-semialdehyde dehydrogenase PutA [Pasteurella multocida]HDR1920225.1 bifunctional p
MTYQLLPKLTSLREPLSQHYRIDETTLVQKLLSDAEIPSDLQTKIQQLARKLVENVRNARQNASGVDALMHEFSLSSQEGVALMCLAEALLRIPDKATADKLIRDKISKGNWRSHIGQSPSMFVNAAAWGLLITGKLVLTHSEQQLSSSLTKLIAKGGEPLIRKGVEVAMRLLGKQFVTGETIEQAIKNGEKRFQQGFRYSYDMLGEAALTEEDAARYYQDYVDSIHAVGQRSSGLGVYAASGVSIKLSAIHPRYSLSQHQRVIDELYPKVKQLFLLAKQYDIGLNIDAEEADRLDISLDLVDRLLADPDLAHFNGIGLVVQAYQKRCIFVIDYLIEQARKHQHKIMVRLVKGAYWDSEIKRAQTDGAEGYPVFTRKVHTDVSYIACAKKLLAAQDVIYPQFATHNAQSLATVYHLAQGKQFEFQCLHGMGETLYDQVVGKHNLNVQCRIYAPVGSYKTLLAYLVRRLLENGANSSFVNHIVDDSIPVEALILDPVQKAKETEGTMHPKTPLPRDLFAGKRVNSKGYDLTDALQLQQLQNALTELSQNEYEAYPLLENTTAPTGKPRLVFNPAKRAMLVGKVIDAREEDVEQAFENALRHKDNWANTLVEQRAVILEKMADLMEQHMPQLFDLAVREAGKTLNNAIAEVREAVDFCRYYAQEARKLGNENLPRGIVVAISPWNFPLAIFIGEVCSALVTGNVVIAKPAEQTSLMAHFAVKLFQQAGLPIGVLQCLCGAGKVIGEKLVSDPRVDGVIFTGSTDTAKRINQNLAKHNKLIPFIAETGGQNAMIVDSSALAEQVVLDVLNSAFDSAGQRCSALRVLYVQHDVAPHILTMLKGAMAELKVGNPQHLTTDVGPVIDEMAQKRLLQHIETMRTVAKDCYQVPVEPEMQQQGIFVPPTLFELENLHHLKHEVFGPVLHVVRFHASEFNQVIAQINSTGFGLTSGIHSRIDESINHWLEQVHAGNLYVNRNTVGAVVGVQAFGGRGLSGTGPKAGGPFYLQHLVHAKHWALTPLHYNTPRDLSDLAAKVRSIFTKSEQAPLLSLIDQVAQCSPLNTTFRMQGITGEENYLTFTPRSLIAIGNGPLAQQMQALIAVAAVGATAVISKYSQLAAYEKRLADYLFVAEVEECEEISQLIVLDPITAKQKAQYADRPGAILTYVEQLDLALSLFPLLHEQAISINTTAAGGNASLMAEMD